MNAGFCNLATLRRHLLGASLADDRTHDDVLLALGLGTAAMFERRTGRRFAYLAGDTIEVTGDRSHFIVPRYPIVSITSVEYRGSDAETYTTQTGQPWRSHNASGIIHFGAELGSFDSYLRITWTGGFWWETLEPEDDGYPSAAPETAPVALPADLLAAFLLHCRSAWQTLDKTGMDLLKTGSSSQFVTGSIGTLDLSPQVSNTLDSYRRYQLS
jgi:hypothetical protein